MLFMWGLVFAILANVFMLFSDAGAYFSDFVMHFIGYTVVGFAIGIAIRKWIVRTFWM